MIVLPGIVFTHNLNCVKFALTIISNRYKVQKKTKQFFNEIESSCDRFDSHMNVSVRTFFNPKMAFASTKQM